MGMDAYIANGVDDSDLKSSSYLLHEGVPNGGNGILEPSLLMEMLGVLDVDLAYSSEKLVNLDTFMPIVSLEEGAIGKLFMQNSDVLEIDIEKALIFDLLFGYLHSEASELGHLLNILRTRIIDGRQQLCSFRQSRDTYLTLQEKLHASETSWEHLQQQLSELMRQLANMNAYSLADGNFKRSEVDLQTAGQQRLVLRMLDKSLSGELDLEKQLSESKAKEEALRSQLLSANKTVYDLESFVEVALERLLETEHSCEVFMGIAKEMMTRFHSLQFNLKCSVWREGELQSKLQNSERQLKEKEIALLKMENNFAKLNQSSLEKEKLGKLKILEEKLQSSQSKFQEINASYEASQEELSLMKDTLEALKAHAFVAETRAHDEEDKLATLTVENIELREELEFLKGGDSNVEKIRLLQKQVRDLEVELQTAKASTEASLEQQNMLYTAIWDMETLIEELRSKVSKAESRADTAEQQCLALAETHVRLTKEVSYLKSNSERLEECLKEADNVKVALVKDINSGAKLMTEMVMQLASERERIQMQLSFLSRENKILLAELRKMRKMCGKANQGGKDAHGKDSGAVVDDEPASCVSIEVSAAKEVVETPTSTTTSNQLQVEESTVQDVEDKAEAASSSPSEEATTEGNVTYHDHGSNVKSKHVTKTMYMPYILAASFLLVFSILAATINGQHIASLLTQPYQ